MGDRRRSGVFAAIALAAILAVPAAANAGTVTVSTSADEFFTAGGSGCSIREAISTAAANATTANGCSYNATGGINDTIQFASSSVDPVLTIAPTGNADDNASGDLDIEADPATEGTLTIQGLGQSTTTVEGGVGLSDGPDRLIDHEDGTLEIKDLTLKDGNTAAAAAGGGIRSRPGNSAADVLDLGNVTLSDNTADTNGGGIDATGVSAVNVTNSIIELNDALGAGASGGGINVGSNVTDFTLTDGQVTENTLGPNDDLNNQGGGFANSSAGSVSISGTRISGNTAGGGKGGGVANLAGTLNVSGATIAGNGGAFAGGGVSGAGVRTNINGSQVTENAVETNSAVTLAAGGGIHVFTNAVLTDSVVAGNRVVEAEWPATSLSGAGVSSANSVTLNRSTVSGNFFQGESPGDGSPHFGAGVASNSSSSHLTLLNSTVTGNTDTDASTSAGTVAGFQTGTVVRVIQSTIARNPHSSAAFSLDFPGAGSTVELRGSVIDDGPSACGTFTGTSSYNVDAGASCPVGTGGIGNAAPLLGPLGANGGPTETLALLAGSPAIDRVPLAGCKDDLGGPLAVDQRGLARPVPAGAGCDAGAYEFVPGAPGTTAPPPGNPPTSKKKCKKKKKKHRAASAKKKCKKKKKHR
jgi:fibronectin-binding autotransporter adhesin